MSIRFVTALLAGVLNAACGSGRSASATTNSNGSPAESRQLQPPAVAAGIDGQWFTERAGETGLDFVHFNGMSGQFYQTEIMSPGVDMFDYDKDGDLDVFITQVIVIGKDTPLLLP